MDRRLRADREVGKEVAEDGQAGDGSRPPGGPSCWREGMR